MTRVFVLTNHKGGVGKSTSATTIAFGISAILRRTGASNSRVLLIDTDSQGHATLITTGQKDYGVDNSLYTVLAADRQVAAQTLANCIVPSTWDSDLHVLPASPLLEGAERELMQVAGAPYRLADPLARISSHYAAVVIDTRPSFSLLTEMALIAATDAIVPVEPRYLETVGLMNVMSKINEIREGWRHPNLKLSGLLQTLAFNMITTSDPTGPAMFRLIHQTGCTVGIDEAERYHNPKDPAMMQIKQLLNSGYKHGMPAIRLMGENMKPQTFDVYSPKVMAAIMGLEDVLASRCISIPMRRTDKKMPSFAADFDGAALRHQLYSLVLTAFQPIYTNYFERPKLHKLHNRSGELWSPLVALAAFFEEQGGIPNLLSAISNAASWDDQVSEGQSLSEREETVLQALDLMTHKNDSVVWIRATTLREQIARLVNQPVDQMGHTQWIAHILKRLYLMDESKVCGVMQCFL